MRVSFVTPWDAPCGIAFYSRRLVAELGGRVDLRVVANERPPPRGLGPVSYLPAAAHYRRLARQAAETDLCHLQFQYFLFGGVSPLKAALPAFLGALTCPAVVTVHELDLGPVGGGWRGALIRRQLARLNALLLHHPAVRLFFVHTPEYVSRLVSLGVPEERVLFAPMPVPPVQPAQSLPSAEAAREKLGLAGKRVATIFGFIVRRKGYERALEALQELPGDVALLLAGGAHPQDRTGYAGALAARVQALGLQDRVSITGFLGEEEVAAAMAASDLVLAPFEEMSGSASLATCLSFGKPILASPLPANVQVQAEGAGMALFDSAEPGGLARAIRGLLDDPAELTRLSAASGAYARTHSFAALAEQTLAAYTAALALPAAPSSPA